MGILGLSVKTVGVQKVGPQGVRVGGNLSKFDGGFPQSQNHLFGYIHIYPVYSTLVADV